MTLVVIGPVTEDLIITKNKRQSGTGGASYFQSFVFEEFYKDYIVIVNSKNKKIINEFPDSNKIKLLLKNDTHYFINHYPIADNPDIRKQSTNFANIPITVDDLKDILHKIDEIDAFVLNPLNRFDFPEDTIRYIKSFKKPVYMSIQGLLRTPSDTDNSIKLKYSSSIKDMIYGIEGLFLDENESEILFKNNACSDFNINEIIITNGSKGSRLISDKEYKIEAVKCNNIVDSTGCGDTFMAAYISKKLTSKSSLKSADFASLIASRKLKSYGPFNVNK